MGSKLLHLVTASQGVLCHMHELIALPLGPFLIRVVRLGAAHGVLCHMHELIALPLGPLLIRVVRLGAAQGTTSQVLNLHKFEDVTINNKLENCSDINVIGHCTTTGNTRSFINPSARTISMSDFAGCSSCRQIARF